jgi:hypothetical protein
MTAEANVADDNRSFAGRFFKRVAQVGAVGCATLLVCAILFLVAVHPSQLRCSPWMIPVPKGAWAPTWTLAPMVALWAVSMCFGAVRWGWFARQQAKSARPKSARRGRALAQYTLTVDFGWPLVVIVAASALLCATPILAAFARCYSPQ